MLIGFIACQKEKAPEPKPTQVEAWMYDAGFRPIPMNAPVLKTQNWWDENGIRITYDSNLDNGTSPGDITLNNGESMQLSYELLEPPTPGAFVAWYTNDQQIASVNWQGLLSGTWIGTWFPGYPNLTCIYLYYYRPNPAYNGHNKKWLSSYIDNVHVYVID
jgi:hypothetical protein